MDSSKTEHLKTGLITEKLALMTQYVKTQEIELVSYNVHSVQPQ